MKTLLREINLSDARRQLSSLLREIGRDPDVGYRILVRDRVVAELRSPQSGQGGMRSGEALLRAARMSERALPRKTGEAPSDIARNYKEHLYGEARPASTRKRA